MKYTKGYWSFSHGQIDKGESSRDTAYREIKEEAGLDDLKPFEGFKTTIGLFYRKEGTIVHKDITFYLAQAKLEDKDKVKLAEHTEYCWSAFDEAIAKLQFKNDKEVLAKVKEFSESILAVDFKF